MFTSVFGRNLAPEESRVPLEFVLLATTGRTARSCNESFTGSVEHQCVECVDKEITIPLTIVSLLIFISIVYALVQFGKGISKRIPLSGIKIIVVVYQIVTQFSNVAYAAYPDAYEKFLAYAGFFNLNLTCFRLSHVSWILTSTTIPLRVR